MLEFPGRTAVVTGAASGIGRGLVEEALARGMKVVAADVDQGRLDALARDMDAGDRLLVRATDVSSSTSVKALADAAVGRFGKVHLLFNNAGVLTSGKSWEQEPEDWSWLLGVNVLGVVHGIRYFVPAMLAHGEPGAVVNTSSMGGLLPSVDLGAYTASKFAVVGLSETLLYELQSVDAKLSAAVICPGAVKTDIMHSERLRGGDTAHTHRSPDLIKAFREGIAAVGMAPRDLARLAFEQVAAGKFWIFPHPDMLPAVEHHAQMILSGETPRYHPMQAM
jgi:NAD(P)-dependent dehydrogenase (short-subunit alcohol dehydrogenase family)